MKGLRAAPADAYRYARGEPIGLPPYDGQGRPLSTQQLARPLDFAAVTDHAELLGETRICRTPGLQGYDSPTCRIYRASDGRTGQFINLQGAVGAHLTFCGPDGAHCRAEGLVPWRDTQRAAEAFYDRSGDCNFTTFVAFEWTAGPFLFGPPRAVNLHRNVIFRNDLVPRHPISTDEALRPGDLWRQLDASCTRADNACDAVVIPHNSNLSIGQMFETTEPAYSPSLSEEDARRRARLEVLVEIFQHKGASECLRGAHGLVASDELCAFEVLPWSERIGAALAMMRQPPEYQHGFLREVLRDGFRHKQRFGFNPFALGFIGSTDSHRAIPGGVDEYDFTGHNGQGFADGPEPQGLPDVWAFNPGGLAVLYAEQNTRESLFAAMRRREAYGTSGPRMTVRFFGADELPADLCARDDLVEVGYRRGVPMGGELRGTDAATFVVAASKDAGTAQHPGGELQQIQIIKGWVDGDGQSRERVITVAGDPDNGASVDTASCQPRGSGFDNLCAVWRDEAFDPERDAYYYARVVENPSCRWTTWFCNAQGVDCTDASAVTGETAMCCDAQVPKTIRERAWTSPIWYVPDA